jgi:NADH-quinone oxidoreductase subunit K
VPWGLSRLFTGFEVLSFKCKLYLFLFTMFVPEIFDVLFFSFVLFFVSFCGIFILKKNLILILMILEILLFSINLNFIFYSVYLDDTLGQLFAIFILTIAAAESALGLALLVVYYRLRGLISLNTTFYLKK